MRQQVVPYSKIAPFYDEIMEHVNYKQWAKYIKTILSLYQHKPKTIIDLSCGTGSLFKHLKSTKWKIFGNDLSFEMLELVQEKVGSEPIPIFCSDFRNLPIRQNSFDLALVLYDSVNYVIGDDQVLPFFDEIYSILKNNGLFIFDAVTPYICKKAFSDYSEKKFWGDLGYKRSAWYIDGEDHQYNEFHVQISRKTYKETHIQKIRSIDEWKKFLENSKFNLLSIYNNFSLNKVHKKTERAHFVCKKT